MSATTIAQRELRNNSGQILKAAQAGATFIVTIRGEPVAKVVSPDQASASDERSPSRPAKRHGGFSAADRVDSKETIQQMLDDLRGEP
ncbi:MAG: type II toxin-antitoxin system prevent-host-death family antitoxin [Micrococcales bacterium]|nr:type II toxin-antitoxin system prevent-host-death family antitoxin [Micrococcales bacterium]